MADLILDQPAHSEIGASSHYRWSKCPGSVRLSRGMPNVSSVYAEEGTLAHTAAAHLLEYSTWPKDIPYNKEMAEAVAVYVDHVHDLIGESGWAGVILVEHRFDLSRVFPGLFGTADCVIYCSGTRTLHVIDYKHGQGIAVEVRGNTQLLYYGLGALFTLPYDIERVVLTIVQPRCFHVEGPVRSWAVCATEVFDFADELYKNATNTQYINAPLVAGDHCQFCPAKGICPELHKTAVETAKQEFSPAYSYDPVKLAETLSKLDAIEAWAKGVRAFAYSEAEHGRAPPGFKLVQKRATRRWRDEKQAAEKFAALLNSNFTRDFYTQPELKSVAQVEKLLPKEHKTILNDLITAESSGLALAPVSDPRPQARVSAKEEFELLAET